jgi:NAD(P)-dependent dehydrogenase (short-subunit alcohol dehydrogenase family)
MRLQGKTAVVTGGGSGIGLAIARALAAEGCHVVIGGRREEVLREAVAGWNKEPKLLSHACDVADLASVQKFFAFVATQLGHVDILVNAAGVNIKTRSMSEMTPEQWDQVLAINAHGTYYCMYEVLPQMREQKDGLIINISSTSGLRSAPLGGVAYNASKFAVSALGTAVGNEDRLHGVRVTTVFPGEVDTPILRHRPQPVSDERKAAMLKPEDVASMVLAIVLLPPRAHVPEIVIKPLVQEFI